MILIQPDTLQFLREVKENNNRPWFEVNKARYIAARENIRQWMIEIIDQMKKNDERIVIDHTRCVGRIYRDIRFSKNKDPYRTFLGAFVLRSPEGANCEFYVHFEPGNIFAGGGIYAPTPQMLKMIREDIAYSTQNLNNIVQHKDFVRFFGKVDGEKLSRAPKGYAPDHPDIEWLRMKQFLVLRNFTDEEVLKAGFAGKVLETFSAARPLFDHIDNALNFKE